ncbi:MAG: acylphosphatase [Syntrophobacteria bacterium]|nr:acylphosphatase [Deltaproteobacteria bacterium]
MAQRLRVHIQGIVQGVGFRPFIYQLAHRHRLNGYVANTPKGVELEVEGGRDALHHFLKELPASAPPPNFRVRTTPFPRPIRLAGQAVRKN